MLQEDGMTVVMRMMRMRMWEIRTVEGVKKSCKVIGAALGSRTSVIAS